MDGEYIYLFPLYPQLSKFLPVAAGLWSLILTLVEQGPCLTGQAEPTFFSFNMKITGLDEGTYANQKLNNIHINTYVCIHVCMYTCVYVYVYVCVYIHVCMYVW